MSKHTPGPWRVVGFTHSDGVISESTGEGIARVIENRYDAYLIAAAPTMYEALHLAQKCIAGLIDRFPQSCNDARSILYYVEKALAQATTSSM